MPHPASLPIDELLRDCEIKRTRGSGPGGQHRNKVETAIVITHRPSGISGQASERRSQKENRDVAIARLRIALAIGVRTDSSETGLRSPTGLWKQRVAGRKINVSPEHRDFAALLAELLDWLVDAEFEASAIARATWLFGNPDRPMAGPRGSGVRMGQSRAHCDRETPVQGDLIVSYPDPLRHRTRPSNLRRN